MWGFINIISSQPKSQNGSDVSMQYQYQTNLSNETVSFSYSSILVEEHLLHNLSAIIKLPGLQ